ncbi:DNA polymerase III subunit tau [Pseudobythopirellula maris]|uniref:DNA polymerase III subunit tau n=1 Tax=Pseudobythopirellula maris TaxID=2527991 RepID=A0A5C5ZT59_9BACT|nr:DNA polymerase III subunit [Pseudobythopirellula maris]TWT90734.1 DNA polymerase III subunit tau [Pseudobythopirellula maris]
MLQGHQPAREFFRRTIQAGRLASTYLFVGPEGIGKRTFAHWLAKALQCSGSDSNGLEACGRCESCLLCDAGSHPDVLTVARPPGKSSLPLDLFIGRAEHRHREGLCHDIALKPYLGRRRVAIIDDADALGVESANCLLKTLEEPPPHSVLILIGTSLARQLPTIRSRAQVVRFAPLDPTTAAQVLESLPEWTAGAPSEGRPDAETLARLARGSVSRALALSDGSAEEDRRAVLGCLERSVGDPLRLAKLLQERTDSAGKQASERRDRLRRLIGFLVESGREAMHAAAAAGTDPSGALSMVEACLDAEEAIDRNANLANVVARLAQQLAAAAPRAVAARGQAV